MGEERKEGSPTYLRVVGRKERKRNNRCMGLNSHGVSKVSVIDAAGVKQVEQ